VQRFDQKVTKCKESGILTSIQNTQLNVYKLPTEQEKQNYLITSLWQMSISLETVTKYQKLKVFENQK
jgi:hypothetical protein